jgi:hypothetical protein
MTVDQIRDAVKAYKPMSIPTLYKHLHAAGVKPVSKVRQIPQQYPDDTPDRILKRLGVTPKKGGAK